MNSKFAAAVLLVSAALPVRAAVRAQDSTFAGADALLETVAGFKAAVAVQKTEDGGRQRMLDEKLDGAIQSADIVEIRRLVALGANPNADDGRYLPPLMGAMIDHGDVDVVNVLLELGAKPDLKDACDKTALHFAAQYGRLEAAQILVAHHATVDAKSCGGETPLVEAAAANKKDVFAYLLSLGADPNAADYQGKTPLILAARMIYHPDGKDIFALLLGDSRTDVNRRDQDGLTALKAVVKGNDVESVKLLLAAPGIDVNDNAGGTTALFLAELDNRVEIAGLLRAAGAKESAALAAR